MNEANEPDLKPMGKFYRLHNVKYNVQCLAAQMKRPKHQNAECLSYLPQKIGFRSIVGFVVLLGFTFFVIDPVIVPLVRSLPRDLVSVFAVVTFFASAKVYLIPAVIAGFITVLSVWRKAHYRLRVQALHLGIWLTSGIFAIAVGGFLINVTKRMIGRARPRHFDELGSFSFQPFGLDSSFASFPSGHATTAGSIIFFCLIFFPKWRYFWGLMAVLFATSRVIVGAHYVSDVMLGVVVGLFFAHLTCAFFARRNLGFERDDKNWTGFQPKMTGLSFLHFVSKAYALSLPFIVTNRPAVYDPSNKEKMDL